MLMNLSSRQPALMFILRPHLIVIGTACALAACGGGGGGSTSSTQSTNTTSGNIVTAPPTLPPLVSIPVAPQNTNTGYYSIAPNIGTCQTGSLTDTVKQSILTEINQIRALHRLAPVIYDYASDQEVMQAALVGAANGQIAHVIDSNWLCYTPIAASGASHSNLLRKYNSDASSGVFSWQPQQSLTDWLTETGAENLGHRRWILNPFLKKIAFGYVDGVDRTGRYNVVNTLKVIDDYDLANATAPATSQPLIAYPIGDYPKAYFNADQPMSVSILADATHFWNNGAHGEVDYSISTVRILNHMTGVALPVIASRTSYDALGLQNSLEFKVDPTQLQDNVIYDVMIDNVKVNGKVYNYSYQFQIRP